MEIKGVCMLARHDGQRTPLASHGVGVLGDHMRNSNKIVTTEWQFGGTIEQKQNTHILENWFRHKVALTHCLTLWLCYGNIVIKPLLRLEIPGLRTYCKDWGRFVSVPTHYWSIITMSRGCKSNLKNLGSWVNTKGRHKRWSKENVRTLLWV